MLRVLVVDDHAVVREGLKRIIDEAPGMQVGGEAADPTQALAHLQTGPWDAVVLDLDLPGRGGQELLRDIKLKYPKLPVLILSFHAEEAYGVPALQAGADGYLMKDSGTGLLVQAIEKVASGGKFVTAGLAEQLARAASAEVQQPRHAVLSERECEVLRLIGTGLTVSEIAERMTLSVKTVSTYRRRVLDKMGLRNSAQLAHYAIEHQLVG
ncbi:MAG: response regulator transcription factor [Rhizobacter sp.]|nr:response regulator transcription factor [Rhizobacter sp.]